MNNNFKDEKIGNNEDNFDDQNDDDDNNDNDIDERQQKLQQSIDDAFIQHPLKTSSSSSLSHKKLSPRSSSYSVSFNIDTIKFDNNKNRTSNMPNLQSTSPPPPPQNTLSMTDNVTPTASSIPLSNVNNQSDLNENESQANRLQPMMITPPPPPSPPPPSFPISSPPPPMPSSSFLSETNQSTKGNHDNNAIGVSRTNSSASIPDYLSQKLDTQSNKAIKATAALNLLKSKRKSIAVSSMLRHNDSLSSLGINHFKQQLQQLQQQKPLHIVKESSDSSTSTTTSESYHINDLPTTLPVKLASLSKPPTTPFSFHSSFRRARHSIDVRALPSYLSKKRQSTFGQLLSVLSPTVQENESTSSDDQLFEEPIAPTLSLGERVAWIQSSGPEFGIVKWIGRMPQITNDWTVGIEFDNAIGSGDGTVDGRRYFVAKENFAKFLPISELTKVDNYAGRPRSGTMLSRMSVQLKPGQLISIQRSPTTTVPHCYLNAPHHVGHDVHAPNNRHCQCNSCNHPCAHICKTRKPKGKRWTEDMAHMCHFSSKPHANMCCGGEDLAAAFEPIKPGTSWKHSNVITSFRTVPTEIIHHRKSTITHSSINMHLLREPSDLLLKKSSTSSSAKQQQPGPTNSSPNFYHDHDHDHHHHHREHLDSGLMERTGSELSISSLPSSSSVAEIYISRPVLTDESDIDSETERSLDSKAKENNKQGFRSLVACFLANSLRLKSMKSYAEKVNNKKNKSSDRSHLRRHKFSDKNNQSNYQQSFENRKLKKNRPIQRLGLSSTDTSYNLDIPNSSVANTQPNNSFSSDFPHQNHQNNDNERQQQLPTTSSSHQLQKSPSVTSSQTSATITSTTFSPKPYLSGNSAKQNFFNAKNSPYRMNEMMQQHHIDGHISEEITNSSSSTSTQRNTTKTESSEKRTTSNYASSENFQSPRRRRNKGPAPKPPNKNDKNHNHMKQSTECSSSPLSVNDAVSTSCNSIPMSLSNSSLSTTNCSNTKLIMTKSPMRQQQQQPPNLVRSLSEQKQLNMKNLINAMPSFRSEINLQEMNLNENNNNDENEIIEKNVKINDYDKSNQECIYEIPLCGKNLLNNNKNNYNSDKNVASVIKNNDIIPELPEKTFDPLKVFGCPMNMETKRLEKSSHHNDLGQEQQQISIQPSIDVDKDKSKPYSKYTCCMYHWKEFLESTSTIEEMNRITEEIPEDLLLLDNNDVCDCDKTSMTTMIDDPDIISDLTNALLSPKHSIKLKKNDFRRQLSKDENQRMKINNNNNDDNNIDNLLNEMNNFELTRAMSDSSLTNTNSATTVVEYNENNKDNETIDNLRSIFNNKNNNETVSQPHNLKDVFVQTSFKNLSEKSPTTATVTTTRRCKHNKHCRCRAARYRNHHRKDCRHQQHACTLHNECCLPSATVNNSITNSLYLSVDDNHKKLSNIWLTSSTSDHSLSSLSSSNSTLSETPSHIRHKNDINSRNYYHIAPSITSNTWSAATPMITKFNRPSITSESEQKKILPEDLVSTQQSIYTEKMYRNTQDNIDHNQIQMQTFPTGTISRKTKKSKDSAQNFNDGYQNKNDPNSWSRCLLSQLETAIANGDHHSASIIAKELAFKKVNCSFIAGKFGNSSQSDIVSGCDYPIVTYLYIEDNMSHKGPIPFQLYPSMSVKMLKIKVEKEFDIPSELQQWIFGKNLAINMDASLSTYGITHSGCSIFLQIKNNDNNGKDFEKDLNLPASMSNEEKLIDINTFNTTNDTANGDLFEKDDDSIYESLRLSNDNDDELPPYSTTIVADNNDKISNKKLHVQTINDEKSINYIQNPLASLEFDVINTISSRTSFNETIQTIASNEQNLSSMTTTTTNTKFFYPENIINIDQSSSSYPKELVFESLNFINEMLPRVEEENEDELEEYDDDDDDDDGNEDNENNKHDINDLQNKIGNINHNEKENSVNEKFDCPKRLLGTEINNDYTKSDQEQIKCLSCDNNNSNKSNENEITNRDIVIN